MAVSQNGWTAIPTSQSLVPLRWITGRVRAGDVHTVLDYLGEQFNKDVERIRVGESWGWAYRAIRAGVALSNHASGTAVDFNAPSHPLGKSGTFNIIKRYRIRQILKKLEGVVRWGGDYPGRKDEMHFEINASAAAVKRVANKIRDWRAGSHRRATTTVVNLRRSPEGAVVRKLPKGFKFTVVNGSGKKVGDLWWVKTTSGNWIASKYTKKV